MDDKEWAFYTPSMPQEQLADINNNVKDHFSPAFNTHNKFADQSLYNNLSAQYFEQNGVQCIYYVSTISTTKKAPFVGNQTQGIYRSFHTKIVGDSIIQPELIKFAKFGASGLDQTSLVLHREVFFKHNARNLRERGIKPDLDPNKHNPWISQRGYADFNYEGYSAAQIFPKAGDLIKPEWIETLYVIDSVNTKLSDQSFMQRSYYFKIAIREYHDDHRNIDPSLATESTNTGNYIEEKFDQTTTLDVGPLVDNGPIDKINNPDYGDTDKFWKDIGTKDDVLYRPPEVPDNEKNISNSKKYGQTRFGKW